MTTNDEQPEADTTAIFRHRIRQTIATARTDVPRLVAALTAALDLAEQIAVDAECHETLHGTPVEVSTVEGGWRTLDAYTTELRAVIEAALTKEES